MSNSSIGHGQEGRIRSALRAVARRPFVDGELLRLALDDPRVPGSPGHATPPPETIERVLSGMHLPPDGRVLVVGTGSGYAAAVASRLVGQVFTLERRGDVALMTRNRLRALGYENVLVRRGEGLDGWIEEAPFDAIFVFATAGQVGPKLLAQLTVGGSLLLPERPFRPEQHLIVFQRTAEEVFERRDLGIVRLVPRIGDLLVDAGLAERDDVEIAAHAADAAGELIGERLMQDVDLEETDLYRALALQGGWRFASIETLVRCVDCSLARSVSRVFAERHQVIPLLWSEGRLVVATCTPDTGLAELAQVFGASETETVLVTPTDFRRFWSSVDLGHADEAGELPNLKGEGEADLLTATAGVDAHAVSLLDALLLDAIAERASDIHLETYGGKVRVRLRVDGELHDCERFELDRPDLLALVNVLKVSAGLDITERRLPQGGRFHRRAGEHAFDLRLQTQPSFSGEHAVIRLLPEDGHHLDIAELGFSEAVAADWRRLLRSPSGLVLVVGPTGCGKTTTLYSGLRVLADDVTRKVITVEDPIEYSIPNISQTQINTAVGYVFASAMRSFVRQDPDVILLGEIRDPETALEAIRASQTGHLVLSTLHCNDAPDSVQRLLDLGLHPNSIASELLAAVAQRLGRRVCESCRQRVEPDAEIAREVFGAAGVPEGFEACRGRGCERCSNRGTHGRSAIAEVLLAREGLRDLIARQPPLSELRRAARASGLVPLREAALERVRDGLLPFEELPRLLTPEQMAPTPGA